MKSERLKGDVAVVTGAASGLDRGIALELAMHGAVGAGIFNNLDEAIENMVRVTNHIDPIEENVKTYDRIYDIFEKSYRALAQEAFPAIAKYQGF